MYIGRPHHDQQQAMHELFRTDTVTRIERETAIQGHSRSCIWGSLKSRREAVYPVYNYV